jgi:hypothetical protein
MSPALLANWAWARHGQGMGSIGALRFRGGRGAPDGTCEVS